MKKCVAALLALALLLTLSGTALAEFVLAIANPTYVRTGPGLDYKIVDSLVPGYAYEWAGGLIYDGRGVAWYSVYYENGYGWVSSLHGNLIDEYSGGSHNDPRVSLGNGTSIQATADVTVRTGPGTDYARLGTLYKGMTADYTGISRKAENGRLWYQINFYNQTGWVSSKYARIY